MNSQTVRISGVAIASLILGILSLVKFGLFAGIPAVICGHIALSSIKKDTRLSGRELAIAGLIIGYLGTALSIIAGSLFLLEQSNANKSIEQFMYNMRP